MATIITSKREYKPNAVTAIAETKVVTDGGTPAFTINVEIKATTTPTLIVLKNQLLSAIDILDTWIASPL